MGSLSHSVFFKIILGDYIYFKKAQEVLNTIKHQDTKIFLEKCIVLWTLKTIEAERFGKYEFRTKVQ